MAHRLTLYDTLGVERDATEDDIRAAFRRLTRANHPDRFFGEERQSAEVRFQSITEAFNVLSRPEAREKYDRELAVHGNSEPEKIHDPREIAKRLAAKGVEAYRAGNLQDAMDRLQLAIDHDENSDRAHYYMGFVLSRFEGRERDAFRHLERAVSLDQHNPVYLSQAAVAALSVGLKSRAERLAQQALALDPTIKQAQTVLTQLDSDDDPKQKDGLFGRMRRKG